MIFLRITLLLIFYSIATLLNPPNALTNENDDFPIHISIYPTNDSVLSYVNISILDSLNNIVLKYPVTTNELKERYHRTVLIKNWNRDKKKLSINVIFNNSNNLHDTAKFLQEITTNGKEKSIYINLDFKNKDSVIFLRRFTATKFYDSSKEVILQRDWIPSKNEDPEYKIINHLTQPIYGTDWCDYFWGGILIKRDNYWMSYSRGVFCGTVAQAKPIQPGEFGYSFEGFFIGTPEPFEIGEYRYVDYYSLTPVSMGIPLKNIEANITTVKIREFYKLVDEFSIDE